MVDLFVRTCALDIASLYFNQALQSEANGNGRDHVDCCLDLAASWENEGLEANPSSFTLQARCNAILWIETWRIENKRENIGGDDVQWAVALVQHLAGTGHYYKFN